MLKKILTCALLVGSQGDAVQVIEMHPAPSVAQSFGEGVAEGMRARMAEEMARKREEARIQAELNARAAEQDRNSNLLQDLLQGYHPSKNSEFVLKILQSSLPNEVKKCVIDIINEQARLYLANESKRSEK